MIDWRLLRKFGLLMTLALLAALPASGRNYTALVAFGDSYTDTGRVPSTPPQYYDGRFSNGRLWVEYLSDTLGFSYNPVNNYAVSGSESDELGEAIAKFPGTKDSSGVLFGIWSGNNDFQSHLDNGTNDAYWSDSVAHTLSSLTNSCDLLYQKGARNIVLFNQIDITQLPIFGDYYSSAYGTYILGKINDLNSQLSGAVQQVMSSDPGLQINIIDAYDDLNNLLANYTSYGFINDSIGAINDPNLSNQSFTGPGANYVFWDNQHPTTKTHALIAGWVANDLGFTSAPSALTIEIDGEGTVSPNYNGKLLKVGQNYSVTATPTAGFAFAGWADASGTPLTTARQLTFTMGSDLTLVAAFTDSAPPTVTVDSPGASVNQPTLLIKGTAHDNVGVAGVYGQINGGGWQLLSSDNNFVNWYTTFQLNGGANTLQFYSVDTSGNTSKTTSLNVTYITSSALTLGVNGEGKVTPTYANQLLVVGKTYAITAVPAVNNLFASWTATGPDGSVTYTNNPLRFSMESNMVLTANFVPNSFLLADGFYNGIFSVADTGVAETTAGMLHNFRVSTLGVFSGQILLGGATYPLSGRFQVDGTASVTVQRARTLGPLQVTLALNWDTSPSQLTGSVSGTDGGGWTADLVAELAGNEIPSASYTMLLPPQTAASGTAPPGYGYAAIADHNGTVTVSGALADGTAFSQTVSASTTGDVPVYANLYNRGGLLLGWINLANGSPAGSLTWIRPAANSTSVYAGGFYDNLQALLSTWTAPTAGQPAIPLAGGQLNISGADGSAPQLSFAVDVNTKSQLIKIAEGSPANTLTGSINPKTGIFTLAFGNGNGRATTAGRGAVLQSTSGGGGFFLNGTSAGAITLTPAAQ